MTAHDQASTPAGNSAVGEGEPRHVRQVPLPPVPQSAGLAREEVRSSLASWGQAREGGGELGLGIAEAGPWRGMGVSDADPRPPRPRPPGGLDESGCGLVLVETLAAKWGVDQGTTGKTVWVELDTRQAGHPGS